MTQQAVALAPGPLTPPAAPTSPTTPQLAPARPTAPRTPALAPLPHVVYFVNRDRQRWADLLGNVDPPPVETLSDRMVIARDIWVVQTYVQLRRRGLDVRLGDRLVPGAINVVSYDDLTVRQVPFNCYMVACRHDRGRPQICEHRIVQNKLNVLDPATDHFMPHWPQPGIVPRDESRGDRIENAVYMGSRLYVKGPLSHPALTRRLQDLGVTFTPRFGDVKSQKADWTDYREVDLVFAVRDCTVYDANQKPPSKLINAWLAGAAALLGPESAFEQLRESELDFIPVRTVDDIVDAVERLKRDPLLYRAIRENGLRRGQEFTADRTAQRWRDLLAGPIAQGYERWRRSPLRLISRPLRFAARLPAHRLQRLRYRREIHRGPRLLAQ
jgi:hypothetical protein